MSSAFPIERRPELYDALIDWPRRLANEAPFYRRLFEQVGVRRVLDAACGTGHHAAMFHEWGIEVEGADVSATMIAHCRRRRGEGERLRWVQRSFAQPADPPGAFDAAICVGNSLALAPDLDTVRRAIAALLASVRPSDPPRPPLDKGGTGRVGCTAPPLDKGGPGGVVVIQVLNLWPLAEGPVLWQKHLRMTLDGLEHVLVKGVHRAGRRGFVHLLDLQLRGDGLAAEPDEATFLGLEAGELIVAAYHAGAADVSLLGSFKSDPYRREQSQDLILVCRRG